MSNKKNFTVTMTISFRADTLREANESLEKLETALVESTASFDITIQQSGHCGNEREGK